MRRFDAGWLAFWLAIVVLGWVLMRCEPAVVRDSLPPTPTAPITVVILPTVAPSPTLRDVFTVPPTQPADVLPLRSPEPTATVTPVPTSTPEPPTVTPVRTPVQRGSLDQFQVGGRWRWG